MYRLYTFSNDILKLLYFKNLLNVSIYQATIDLRNHTVKLSQCNTILPFPLTVNQIRISSENDGWHSEKNIIAYNTDTYNFTSHTLRKPNPREWTTTKKSSPSSRCSSPSSSFACVKPFEPRFRQSNEAGCARVCARSSFLQIALVQIARILYDAVKDTYVIRWKWLIRRIILYSVIFLRLCF